MKILKKKILKKVNSLETDHPIDDKLDKIIIEKIQYIKELKQFDEEETIRLEKARSKIEKEIQCLKATPMPTIKRKVVDVVEVDNHLNEQLKVSIRLYKAKTNAIEKLEEEGIEKNRLISEKLDSLTYKKEKINKAYDNVIAITGTITKERDRITEKAEQIKNDLQLQLDINTKREVSLKGQQADFDRLNKKLNSRILEYTSLIKIYGKHRCNK